MTRTRKRQIRMTRIFPNTVQSKNLNSERAGIRIARLPLRKRIRLLNKLEEVHVVATASNLITLESLRRKFQVLCRVVGIMTQVPGFPRELPLRLKVNAYLHTAPLRYPNVDLPLDSAATWKKLKKLQVCGRISKQRFQALIEKFISQLATS